MNHAHDTVTLRHDVVRTLQEASRGHLPHEVGGILLGYYQDHRIVVTYALIVPTPAPATTLYVRDDVAANELLQDFLHHREPDDPVGYVGEWHSHPDSVGPSPLDIKALRATARGHTAPLVLLVCTPDNDPGITAVFTRRNRLGHVQTRRAHLDLPTPPEPWPGPLPQGAVRPDGPVFLSYRHADGYERTNSLEGLLRAAGIVVWRDERDLRGGTTIDRLDHALTSGLSGAVLVVTPDIAHSPVVKERELPRLLQLDQDLSFSLNIANEIPNPKDPTRLDHSAPDQLLGLAPAHLLADKKHSDTRTLHGRQEIVRDLLLHRMEERRASIQSNAGTFTLKVQTRPAPFATEADHADLHIRIPPAAQGRLPSREGLEHLRATLPLTSDAIRASGATTVTISGGAHLSVALALGAALPATKIARLSVLDLAGDAWNSGTVDGDTDHKHTITTTIVRADPDPRQLATVAVFISLSDAADTSAFERLVASASPPFHSVARIRPTQAGPLHPRESGRLSLVIAQEIRHISAEHGRAHVHLAYHGPYPMAVLIGRLLNTLRTTIYEWDDPEDLGPRYVPTVTLEPGTTQGPITKVLI